MDGWIRDICRFEPRMEQVPSTLVGWVPARAHKEIGRPVHGLENNLEADCLELALGEPRRLETAYP
jgi:hypothetical protein